MSKDYSHEGDTVDLITLLGFWGITVLGVALVFDFINGFHDTANAVATVFATKVMSARVAVTWAAGFNLLGALFGGEVAATVGKDLIDANAITYDTILAALLAAIAWNLFTWKHGIPSSSSHALLAGLLGATIATAGPGGILIGGLITILIGLVFSPFLGLLAGYVPLRLLRKPLSRIHPDKVDAVARRLQILTSALVAFSHGGNDSAKTAGVITLALITSRVLDQGTDVPRLVLIVSGISMGLGTYMGGWPIIHTMGTKLTKLTPQQGAGAEFGAALVIELASRVFHAPISTTQTIAPAIAGAGAAYGMDTICYQTVRKILLAWICTIPTCFLLSWTIVWILGVVHYLIPR